MRHDRPLAAIAAAIVSLLGVGAASADPIEDFPIWPYSTPIATVYR